MAMDDNVDTHPAKKMKLQDEEIPKSQDAAKEEKIHKSQDGTNTVNFEDLQNELCTPGILRSSREHPMSLFSRMIKDVGCCESQIIKKGYSSYCFLANLTPEEAKKLSDLDSVKKVKPYKTVYFVCDNRPTAEDVKRYKDELNS